MQRRHLIQSALGTAALSMAGGLLLAADKEQSRFLMVFLRGGYDAASLLVPIGSSFYYDTRPGIAIARPSADLASALPLDSDWGLHPALRDTVYPMFQSGEAAFIPFAGSGDASRSHFETQDSIEMGQPLGQSKDYRSGFLNRLSAVLHGSQPMAFTEQIPLAFQGTVQVSNTALRSLDKPALSTHQSQLISAMYGQSKWAATVNQGFAVRSDVAREMAAEMDKASRNAISTKGFEQQALRMARLMRERYNLGFVDVGGWDTHVGQGGARGYLASRLDELGRGLAAFALEMGSRWRDTTVVVMSEFGRTMRQNGSGGTDHGHGSVYWVLGGSVRGGKVLGEQVRVEATSLFQNRDYPVLNDYRAILAGLFKRQYGLTSGQIEQVFAMSTPQDMGLL